MSDMGVIATNLHCASRLLERYNLAPESVGSRGGCVEREDEARSLLAVLAPFSRHLRGRSYYALGVHGEEMSEFLRLRHREDVPPWWLYLCLQVHLPLLEAVDSLI